jgi:hypothetical protein
LAAYPALRFGGREGLQSMLMGAALGWVTIVGSYAAMLLACRNVKHFAVAIVLGGFIVRFALVFALLALISKTLAVDLGPLVLWLVCFYMVLVVAEAVMLASSERRSEG